MATATRVAAVWNNLVDSPTCLLRCQSLPHPPSSQLLLVFGLVDLLVTESFYSTSTASEQHLGRLVVCLSSRFVRPLLQLTAFYLAAWNTPSCPLHSCPVPQKSKLFCLVFPGFSTETPSGSLYHTWTSICPLFLFLPVLAASHALP